jgi:phage terminase large subunit-like protein
MPTTMKLRRLHPAQRRIKREARRFNVLDCGRQFGKSTEAIDLAIAGALRGWPVGYFSPTYKMQTEIWREVDHTTKAVQRDRSAQERRIELTTGGVIDFWSLDSPNSARGRRYRRILVDEAAMIPDLEEIWNAVLRATLLRYQGDAWFMSTPRGFNYFHMLWERGQVDQFPEWMSWQMPSSENPHLAPADIEQARQELPERVFRQEYLAEFVADGAIVWLRDWFLDRFDPRDERRERVAIARYLSYDTAAKDGDANAYTAGGVWELGPDYRLDLRHVWRDRLLFPNLVGQVEHDIREWNRDGKLQGVVIEDKSSGTGLYQTLYNGGSEHLRSILVPFQPTGSKDQRFEQAGVWGRNGSVRLPRPGPDVPWLYAYEGEVFRVDAFQDQRDMSSQMILYLEHILAAGWRARQGVAA